MRHSKMSRSFVWAMIVVLAGSAFLVGCEPGVCGNGICGVGEHPWDCPDDCFCGDGICRGEDCCSCPEDCHYGDPDMPCAGNERCDVTCGETFVNAPADCDRAAINPDRCVGRDDCYCGDSNCDFWMGENCDTCPGDCVDLCANCGDGSCHAVEEDEYLCPEDCGEPCGNGSCDEIRGENCLSCPDDCGDCSACGDGVCDLDIGETCMLCPEDCHLGDPIRPCCGNDVCELDENPDVCPCDCDSAPCSWGPPDTCGNGILEPGEECETEGNCYQRNYGIHRELNYRPVCNECACAVPCDHDGVCEPDDREDCRICPDDCNYGDPEATCCGDGFCTLVLGEDFGNCPGDCPPTLGPSLPLMSAWNPMWLEPPSYCGNDTLEEGEECESDADCTTPGAICTALCYCAVQCQETDPCHNMGPGYPCTTADGQSGVCEWNNCDCVVAVCGNGVTEGGEECETDAECPTAYYCRPGECWCDHIVCGDGVCSTMMENSDLCPEDCGAPAVLGDCGAPCEDSEDCQEGLACFERVCWEDCRCEGRCGGESDEGSSTECRPCGAPCEEYCSSPDTFCDNGCCRCP